MWSETSSRGYAGQASSLLVVKLKSCYWFIFVTTILLAVPANSFALVTESSIPFFQKCPNIAATPSTVLHLAEETNTTHETAEQIQVAAAASASDNKAMAFLKKIGRVGGKSKADFTNAIGVDEGSSTKAAGKWGNSQAMKKSREAFRPCTETGLIDDLSEAFPSTSSGCQWDGITDRVMGGVSSGTLSREDFHGRNANVLRANVRLENNGGFVQMATDLALDPAVSNTVDASEFQGIELDVFFEGDVDTEKFNIHLKNANCLRQFSSYRATFELPEGQWTTIRLPWDSFCGHGCGAVENALDVSSLRRIGVVAIGKGMDVTLALSSIRFFGEASLQHGLA